jgi:hypothetical protein
MLEITVQYTVDDLARGNRFILFKHRFQHQKYLTAFLLLFSVGMMVFAFAQPAQDWRNTFLIIGVVFLLITLGSLGLERIVVKQMAKQVFRDSPHVRYPQTYAFEDENLTITGELFDANLKWQALLEAAETDTDFFLFITKDQAYILPKRVFKANEEPLLRSFLKNKLQERAKLN